MTEEKVLEALKNVIYPGFTKDIVSFGFVKEVDIDGESVKVSRYHFECRRGEGAVDKRCRNGA